MTLLSSVVVIIIFVVSFWVTRIGNPTHSRGLGGIISG